MEMIHGVGALKFLDPNYPYNDVLLLPSLMYKFGLAEHTDRMHNDIQGVNPAIPFTSDPSIDDDVVIDDFHSNFTF